MAKRKFLLVCEGPTDIEILSSVSKALTNINGHSVEIIPLSPQRDATSGQYPRHGWTEVRAWCQTNKRKTAADVASINPLLRSAILRKNWSFLVQASGADGVIIQIDTDIAGQIIDCPLGRFTTGNIVQRKIFTETAILNWLSEPKSPKGIFLILSSYSTETWIMACHSPADSMFTGLPVGFDYEDVHDVEARLITKGYAIKSKAGVPKLEKKTTLYAGYAKQIISSIVDVRSRCSTAHDFCTLIENVA